MKFDADSLEAKHSEIVEWIEWFMLHQAKRGAGKEQKEFMSGVLYAFMDSGAAFASGGQAQVKCPRCQGRGNTGLMLIGATEPALCSNCEGTGFIQAGVTPDGP